MKFTSFVTVAFMVTVAYLTVTHAASLSGCYSLTACIYIILMSYKYYLWLLTGPYRPLKHLPLPQPYNTRVGLQQEQPSVSTTNFKTYMTCAPLVDECEVHCESDSFESPGCQSCLGAKYAKAKACFNKKKGIKGILIIVFCMCCMLCKQNT